VWAVGAGWAPSWGKTLVSCLLHLPFDSPLFLSVCSRACADDGLKFPFFLFEYLPFSPLFLLGGHRDTAFDRPPPSPFPFPAVFSIMIRNQARTPGVVDVSPPKAPSLFPRCRPFAGILKQPATHRLIFGCFLPPSVLVFFFLVPPFLGRR